MDDLEAREGGFIRDDLLEATDGLADDFEPSPLERCFE